VDVEVHTKLAVKSAKEMTQPRELKGKQDKDGIVLDLRVSPGDVQVIDVKTR
jgi:hypothetical protein